MCGIAGIWDQRRALPADALEAALRRMTDSLQHRGPDDSGAWIDRRAGLALGQRRLSIIDVSEAGHQPMASADGRNWIVFNGEIYNYPELRSALEAEGVGGWRGHSDTEVLLAAIGRWGVRAALERVVGMFAFALWDMEQCTLTLARDRLGEKPLYYGWSDGVLLFASELKALRAFPGFRGALDHASISNYLRFACVPSPRSIYEGVLKLPPAHFAIVSDTGRIYGPLSYWSWQRVTSPSPSSRLDAPQSALADQLDALLRRSIAGQMLSDVPLGAFLSGGVDSSTVVALMQAQSTRPIRTFSIGFAEPEYDESPHARAVAQHLGTDHTELVVTPGEAMDVIPRLPAMYDEPFGDSSQIPTFLVSRLARQHVTVALSGEGGDELFGGYNRYGQALRIWRSLARLPAPLRRAAARVVLAQNPARLHRLLQAAGSLLPPSLRAAQGVDKLYKLADVMPIDGLAGFYERLVAMWPRPAELLLASPPDALTSWGRPDAASICGRAPSGEEAMMALDLVTYLPDDILAKVDRAAMATSLETRVPLLDHRVVEFAWQLPLSARIEGTTTKRILRDVLYRYVPPALIERPKQGFGLPIDAWLRGPLRDWAEALLSPQRLARDGIFRAAPIVSAWNEHLAGRRNLQYPLWTVLMFQAWKDAWSAT